MPSSELRLTLRTFSVECAGTAALVLIGCGAAAGGGPQLQTALAFGLAAAALLHVPAVHINPAVTAAMTAAGRCSVCSALARGVAQCTGAAAGAGLLRALSPSGATSLGATMLAPGLTPLQGFAIEAVLGFVLLLTVFAVSDENRLDVLGSGPIAVGFAIAACHCYAIPLTGSGMNPARSFGTALVSGLWAHHWIYWVGPVLGGVVAGLLYQHVLAPPGPDPESLERFKLQTMMRLKEKEIITDRTTCI